MAGWVLYELMAVAWAALIPLGWILVGLAGALFPRRAEVAGARRDVLGALLLAVPFAWIAWDTSPEGPHRAWFVVAFLWLALPRWMSHRLRGRALRDGLTGLGAALARGVRTWGSVTGAFLLSGLIVLPVTAVMRIEMPSVDHGQHYLMLGMGTLYFLLQSLVALLPAERWMRRAAGRLRAGTPSGPAATPRRAA